MSRSTPFHKQTDPNKQAGQVVYKITIIDNAHPEGIPYEDWATPLQPIKVEHTLHHYIERKTEKNDLNFVKWFAAYNEKYGLPPAYIVAKAAWEAALSNGKVS